MSLAVLVPAAGHGTRMRSRLPKALNSVAGQPMIVHALGAAEGVSDAAVSEKAGEPLHCGEVDAAPAENEEKE